MEGLFLKLVGVVSDGLCALGSLDIDVVIGCPVVCPPSLFCAVRQLLLVYSCTANAINFVGKMNREITLSCRVALSQTLKYSRIDKMESERGSQ